MASYSGGFVAVWQDGSVTGGDLSGTAIRGQLYSSAGTKIGSEFLINTTTSGSQIEPYVTSLTGGGFAVTWTDQISSVGDASGSAVRLQVYNSSGSPVSGEQQVNTTTFNGQFIGRPAGLAGNEFVVTFTDYSESSGDTSLEAVRAQRFGNTAAPAGSEFLVNSTTSGHQTGAHAAALSGGGFVVTWHDSSQTGADNNLRAVRAQRYDASGTALGSEFLVNTTTSSEQRNPLVAGLTGGGFVIAWVDESATGDDTSSTAVRAQLFTSTGVPVGTEFVANTITSGGQWLNGITALTDGGFAVTWTDGSATAPETGEGIRAQVFSGTGTKVGPEFLVNSVPGGDQNGPRIAQVNSSTLIVAWTDVNGNSDGNSAAVVGRLVSYNPNLFLLTASTDPITGTGSGDTIRGAAAQIQAGDALNGGGGTDVFEVTTGSSIDLRIPATFTDIESVLGSASGDSFVMDASTRGVASIDGGAGSDTMIFYTDTIDLRSHGLTLTQVELIHVNATGPATLTVRASELTSVQTFKTAAGGANKGVLATAEATFDLTGKTLLTVDRLEALIATGATITPPAAWIGTITGGAGNDVITITQTSTSTVEGGLGTDTVVITGAGAITLPTTTDVEAIVYNGGTNQTITLAAAEVRTLAFGTGADVITGGLNPDRVFLGAGNDSFTGANGGDLALGEAGADTLEGGQGADTLFGGTLGSKLDGGTESDTLVGGSGDDIISGGGDTLANLVFGGAGNDSVTGAGILVGGTGADTLIGSTGADTLFGEAGANVLNGGGGDDILIGGADAETIIGGLGNDTVWGSGGADRFTMTTDTSADVIADFAIGVDKLDLAPLGISAAGFAALTQTPMSNGVTLVLSGTQSVSLIGVTTVVLSDVITT